MSGTSAAVGEALDRVGRFAQVDPHDALGEVEHSHQQWSRARELEVEPADMAGRDAVVILGMGGSGIAGDVAAALAADTVPVPLVVHRGYGLPAFVGPSTLVVAVSYSGNTEETESAVSAAIEAGAQLAAVTSGGRLAELGAEHGFPVVTVPAGGQPRHMLGWLAVPLLHMLGIEADLDEVVAVQGGITAGCGRDVEVGANPAKRIGAQVAATEGITVVWGTQGLGAVAAYRMKCQLNENAKLAAFASEIPELDHNEVVGWESASAGAAGLIVMRDPEHEHPRVAARVEPSVRSTEGRVAWHTEVVARGSSSAARLASLILQADLISVYAAIALNRDPTPVRSIARLKHQLAP